MDTSAVLEVPELIELPCDSGITRSKVPITILTGFLGSGKTTLLQHILKSNHGLKIAVLMNEFAESGEIERTITSQKAGKVADEWIEFDNGCLCCTVKDAAVIALEALLCKRTDIQHIVIETSGMANPGPIIQKLWVDQALDCKAELDGVVCLVDALHGYQRLSPESMSYSKEAATQVALADLVIVNKQDLVSPQDTPAIDELIKEINPLCTIMHSTQSEVPLDKVLSIGEYRASQSRSSDPADLLSALSIHTHGHSKRALRNFSIEVPRCLELAAFERWLFTLLWEKTATGSEGSMQLDPSTDIMRVKGILYATNSQQQPSLYGLQAVEQMYELTQLDEKSHDLRCCLIFIGTSCKCTHICDRFVGNISNEDEHVIRNSFRHTLL